MKWNSKVSSPTAPLHLQSICPVLPHEPDSCLGEYAHLVDLKVFRRHQQPRRGRRGPPGRRLRRCAARCRRGSAAPFPRTRSCRACPGHAPVAAGHRPLEAVGIEEIVVAHRAQPRVRPPRRGALPSRRGPPRPPPTDPPAGGRRASSGARTTSGPKRRANMSATSCPTVKQHGPMLGPMTAAPGGPVIAAPACWTTPPSMPRQPP